MNPPEDLGRREFLRKLGTWSGAVLSLAGLGGSTGCSQGGGHHSHPPSYFDYANYADYFDYPDYANYADYVDGGYGDYADYANYANYGDYFDYGDSYGDAYSDYGNYSDYFDYIDYADYANYSDGPYNDYGDYANYSDYADYADTYADYWDYSDSGGGSLAPKDLRAAEDRPRAARPPRTEIGEKLPKGGAEGPRGPARQGVPEELNRPKASGEGQP